MLCLVASGGGYVEASPQPVKYTDCNLILATPADVSVNAFSMTAAEGSSLATAIIGLWAVAVVFRILIAMMRGSDGESEVAQ